MFVLCYSIEHVVVIEDCFIEFIYWWEFVCELSNPSPLGVCLVHFVPKRDEWPFPKDSGLLSLLSFHPLVIWSFSMSWFEQISARLISFRPIILHTLFHSPCLHRFSFIYPTSCIWYFYYIIVIPLQLDAISFFHFIIDTFTLDIFIPHLYINVGRP